MDAKLNSDAPIFIVGSQRSGTTMLRLMLNAHPHIAIPFESGFITRIYHDLEKVGDLNQINNLKLLLDKIAANKFVEQGGLIVNREKILEQHPKSYADLIGLIYQMYAQKNGKIRWGDKEPAYVIDIDILYKIFPNLKVIHLVRDGRDVALSLRNLSWGSKNLPRLAREWAWKVTLARKSGSFLKDQYCEVKYEDLVQNPEATLQDLCAFIDEEYMPEMLKYHVSAAKEMPKNSLDFHKNSVRKPDISKIYMWEKKMDRGDQVIFQEEAGKALELFDYKPVKKDNTLTVKLKKLKYALIERW